MAIAVKTIRARFGVHQARVCKGNLTAKNRSTVIATQVQTELKTNLLFYLN